MNLVAGFLGLVAVAHAHLILAAAMIVLAAICDSLDGTVARRRGDSGDFGTHLDSLADLVSFGIVPALALYMGPLSSRPPIGLTVCAGFVLAAAWRLARFPLVKQYSYFLGVPVPVAGVFLIIMLLSRPGFGITVFASVTASVLMVSTVPFPTLQAVGRATLKVLQRDNHGRAGD
jgi:CDP-diacylglycerol--serine O-phosphatidyltransferase